MKSRASAHWFKDNNGDVTHMNPALRNNDDVCSVCSTNLYHDDEVT